MHGLFSFQTANEYLEKYKAQKGSSDSKYHGYAYDAIWVIAKALDTMLSHNGGQFDVSLFRGEKFQSVLNETSFIGVTVSCSC